MVSKSYPMKMSLAGIFLLIASSLTLSLKGKIPEYRISKAVSSMERPEFSEKKAAFIHSIYSSITASGSRLSEQVFEIAFVGFEKLQAQGKLSQDSILTIIDFSKSSREKRMHVVDLKSGKLVFNSVVAHGRNTGDEFAKSFSNQPNSHKSSLGFYVTGNKYNGSTGLS